MCTEQNAIILNCRVIRAPLPDDDDDDMARAELEDKVLCYAVDYVRSYYWDLPDDAASPPIARTD